MARHTHVHLYAFRTKDAAEITAADYEQLAEELLAFIASKEAGTQDEWKEEEHPRQPDGKFGQGGGSAAKPEEKPAGLGPKPTSTQAKIAKHAVHELLSSGHPWSIDELAAITGHANKTSLSSWISMFKNAKTAGPKGQLSIVKLPNGQYQVVKQDGQPAPKVEVPKAPAAAAPAPVAPPKPAPAPKPPVPKPAPVAKPPAPPASPPVEMGASTVTLPKATNGVSAKDFAEIAGPVGSKFGKDMSTLKSAMEADVTGGGDYKEIIKKQVEAGLVKRLQGSKAFQAFKKVHEQFGPQKGYSPERLLISNWASSSGDSNEISCAMQLAIRDAFNLKDTETGGMHLLAGRGKEAEEAVLISAAKRFGYNMNTPERAAIFKEALRDFAKAQYQETQDWFKARGITEISVVRGMKTPAGTKAKQVSMGLQPASSFSAALNTARTFAAADHATMLAAKIPVSHVLSTYRTGYGCANEHEVVVLGDRSLTAVAMPRWMTANKKDLSQAGRSALESKTPQPA